MIATKPAAALQPLHFASATDTPRLISTPASPALQALPAEINTATRQIHTTLNRLITSRLPLALPPHSSDAALYAHGIAAFAPLYFAFEAAWQELIQSASSATAASPSPPAAEACSNALDQHLRTLIPDGLWRTARLHADLAHLEKTLGLGLEHQSHHVNSVDASPNPVAATVDAVRAHILAATRQRPHVLLAYAWVLYMAIFSGGRWIRAQLESAGSEFWCAASGADAGTARTAVGHERAARGGDEAGENTKADEDGGAALPGLSFLSFAPGTNDGEAIKADFKARLAGVEPLLSAQERQDVIAEASTIFANCIETVTALDTWALVSGAVPDDSSPAGHVHGRHPPSTRTADPTAESTRSLLVRGGWTTGSSSGSRGAGKLDLSTLLSPLLALLACVLASACLYAVASVEKGGLRG